MFVDKRQVDLVYSLAMRKISEEEFLRQFPATSEEKPSLGLRVLEFALSARDLIAVEAGTILGYHYGLDRNYLGILERLAVEDWHRDHEDIIFALGLLASPTSIGAIYAASQSHHPYLENYDDSFQLRSKCIHALKHIGTIEAVRLLDKLFEQFHDSRLRSKIIRRFQGLSTEGATEEVRAAAQAALLRPDVANHKDEDDEEQAEEQDDEQEEEDDE